MLVTIKELWVANGRTSENLLIKSPSNKTPKYKVLMVSNSKNVAVVENYGKRKWIIGPRKKYIQVFNFKDIPRWELA